MSRKLRSDRSHSTCGCHIFVSELLTVILWNRQYLLTSANSIVDLVISNALRKTDHHTALITHDTVLYF